MGAICVVSPARLVGPSTTTIPRRLSLGPVSGGVSFPPKAAPRCSYPRQYMPPAQNREAKPCILHGGAGRGARIAKWLVRSTGRMGKGEQRHRTRQTLKCRIIQINRWTNREIDRNRQGRQGEKRHTVVVTFPEHSPPRSCPCPGCRQGSSWCCWHQHRHWCHWRCRWQDWHSHWRCPIRCQTRARLACRCR